MVKIEAFDNSHFMHQTVRVCHTDHTDSIVSSMACVFNNFLCTLSVGLYIALVWLDNSHFMNQTIKIVILITRIASLLPLHAPVMNFFLRYWILIKSNNIKIYC